jgi:cell fate (sporulation/competence/biofilm development) regulator YlbF (YheA/YmcA/DUF963 family)
MFFSSGRKRKSSLASRVAKLQRKLDKKKKVAALKAREESLRKQLSR